MSELNFGDLSMDELNEELTAKAAKGNFVWPLLPEGLYLASIKGVKLIAKGDGIYGVGIQCQLTNAGPNTNQVLWNNIKVDVSSRESYRSFAADAIDLGVPLAAINAAQTVQEIMDAHIGLIILVGVTIEETWQGTGPDDERNGVYWMNNAFDATGQLKKQAIKPITKREKGRAFPRNLPSPFGGAAAGPSADQIVPPFGLASGGVQQVGMAPAPMAPAPIPAQQMAPAPMVAAPMAAPAVVQAAPAVTQAAPAAMPYIDPAVAAMGDA